MRIGACLAGAALLVTSGSHQAPLGKQFGSIRGLVLNGEGVPIPEAKVYDEPLNTVRIGKDHFVLTDQKGQFLLTDVPAGKTMVIATKIEAKYADARFAVFSGNEVLPIVEVRAGETTPNVTVKLLSKGGVLRGKILDSASKLAVPKARITLSRVDHPEWSIETDPATSGAFEFVIPSKPIHFQVTASGYKPWAYDKSSFSKADGSLTLAPDSTVDVDVYLERIQ